MMITKKYNLTSNNNKVMKTQAIKIQETDHKQAIVLMNRLTIGRNL